MLEQRTDMPHTLRKAHRAGSARSARWILRTLLVVLFESWGAVRLGVWLFWLPVLLRVYPVSTLLHHLTPAGGCRMPPCPGELERVVRMVVRVCHLRCFRGPLFPRACLRQALALYAVLRWQGYPVDMHFGVQKVGENLRGHSWVTLQGTPVAERTRTERFTMVYSYPGADFHSPRNTDEICPRHWFSGDSASTCTVLASRQKRRTL